VESTVSVETSATETTSVPTTCEIAERGNADTPDVPVVVSDQLSAVRDAALHCDLDSLASLMSEDFVASSDPGMDATTLWTDQIGAGQPVFERIYLVATASAGHVTGQEYEYYVWPSIAAEPDTREASDVQRSEALLVHTESELAQMEAEFEGQYVGWELRIRPDGSWVAFTAGD
jgi:hypothetical protein